MELKYEEFKIKKFFLNILLQNGKKNNSEYIFKQILINLKKTTKQKPNFILLNCIKNLLPKLKAISIPNKKKKTLKKRKRDSYFLMFLHEDKQIKKSILLLLSNINQKKLNLKDLTNEIIQTSENNSKSIKNQKELYKDIKKLKFNIAF